MALSFDAIQILNTHGIHFVNKLDRIVYLVYLWVKAQH